VKSGLAVVRARMDILSLRVRLTDADLNSMARTFVPEDAPVDNLRLAVVDGAVQVNGDYPTPLFSIPFQTRWEPAVREGKVCVQLTGIKVVGLPGGMLRGLFLNGFRQVTRNLPGASLDDDTLVLDVDRILASRGVPLKTNLKTIRCTAGQMIVEA
jgi:hypothetical protein